jgi:general secretion pathway protein G
MKPNQPLTNQDRNKQGFTLIEILIVVIILGILAMVLVPQIGASTDEARINTLRNNLTAMRSAIEIYYAQHDGIYPADIVPTNAPADVTSLEEAFVAQMTRYTDFAGNIANVRDTTYKLGPYIKGNNLPMNPFNELSTVTVDNTESNITIRASGGANTGWKFYSKTGVLIAADGAHDLD